MDKSILENNEAWLRSEDNLGFAEYFIKLGPNAKERKMRIQAVNIAAQWCRLAEEGKDGCELPDELRQSLLKVFSQRVKEDGEDEIDVIWNEMCANCAKYKFAEIDGFDLTKALYGIFRIILPLEQDIEPFDTQINQKLIKATDTDFSKVDQFGFCVKTNGLKSEVVILPKDAKEWMKYGDQYLMVLLT